MATRVCCGCSTGVVPVMMQADVLRCCRTGAASNDSNVQQLYWKNIESLEGVDSADSEGFAVIHAAVGNVDILRDVLHRGADVDLQSKQGFTALSLAGQRGNIESMAALLEAGANPNLVETQYGNGPLWFVTMRKWALEAAPLLCSYGADPDLPNRAGESPRDLLTEMMTASPEATAIFAPLVEAFEHSKS